MEVAEVALKSWAGVRQRSWMALTWCTRLSPRLAAVVSMGSLALLLLWFGLLSWRPWLWWRTRGPLGKRPASDGLWLVPMGCQFPALLRKPCCWSAAGGRGLGEGVCCSGVLASTLGLCFHVAFSVWGSRVRLATTGGGARYTHATLLGTTLGSPT